MPHDSPGSLPSYPTLRLEGSRWGRVVWSGYPGRQRGLVPDQTLGSPGGSTGCWAQERYASSASVRPGTLPNRWAGRREVRLAIPPPPLPPRSAIRKA